MRVRHILPVLEHSSYSEMAIKRYDREMMISMKDNAIMKVIFSNFISSIHNIKMNSEGVQ